MRIIVIDIIEKDNSINKNTLSEKMINAKILYDGDIENFDVSKNEFINSHDINYIRLTPFLSVENLLILNLEHDEIVEIVKPLLRNIKIDSIR